MSFPLFSKNVMKKVVIKREGIGVSGHLVFGLYFSYLFYFIKIIRFPHKSKERAHTHSQYTLVSTPLRSDLYLHLWPPHLLRSPQPLQPPHLKNSHTTIGSCSRTFTRSRNWCMLKTFNPWRLNSLPQPSAKGFSLSLSNFLNHQFHEKPSS